MRPVSSGRGPIPVSNLTRAATPMRGGWMVPVVGLRPEQASRWTAPRDGPRIRSHQLAVGGAMEQRRRLKLLCGTRPVLGVADRWSGTSRMP
jgi:hypothetical protein